jgi:hypothetical protein
MYTATASCGIGADAGLQFIKRLQTSRAYRRLTNAGFAGQPLSAACISFWLAHAASLAINSKLALKHQRRRGRPHSFFPGFQVLCDRLASSRADGLRFYREFCELAGMIFDNKPSTFRASANQVESYRSNLMRLRADSRNPDSFAGKLFSAGKKCGPGCGSALAGGSSSR